MHVLQVPMHIIKRGNHWESSHSFCITHETEVVYSSTARRLPLFHGTGGGGGLVGGRRERLSLPRQPPNRNNNGRRGRRGRAPPGPNERQSRGWTRVSIMAYNIYYRHPIVYSQCGQPIDRVYSCVCIDYTWTEIPQ